MTSPRWEALLPYLYGCRQCDDLFRPLSVKLPIRCPTCGRRESLAIGGVALFVFLATLVVALLVRELLLGQLPIE